MGYKVCIIAKFKYGRPVNVQDVYMDFFDAANELPTGTESRMNYWRKDFLTIKHKNQ